MQCGVPYLWKPWEINTSLTGAKYNKEMKHYDFIFRERFFWVNQKDLDIQLIP